MTTPPGGGHVPICAIEALTSVGLATPVGAAVLILDEFQRISGNPK